MADRLAKLEKTGADLQRLLRPEGESPLSSEDIADAVGKQVLRYLRIVSIEAQNGNPFEYGRTLAADLECQESQPLSAVLLSLFIQGIDSSLRYFNDNPDTGKAAADGSHDQHMFIVAATGYLVAKGLVYEACRPETDELTATISFLATMPELTNRLVAVLEDGERFFHAAVEKNLLEDYEQVPEGLNADQVGKALRTKIQASNELAKNS